MKSMKISEEVKGDIAIVRIEGRLDAVTSAQIEAKIQKLLEGKKKLVINLQDVDYLSSAGIRVLLATFKKIKAQNGKLAICSLTDDVMEIIKMAGFHTILPLFPTEEKALASL